MDFKLATIYEIKDILTIQKKYHVHTIAEDDKQDGFVTTLLDKELLTVLIEKEKGLFVAKKDHKIIGYVISASWDYCSRWPMFQFMIKKLGEDKFLGQQITIKNSYQYGPICIEKEFRGTGVLEGLFDFARSQMQKRYPILITFVNINNLRSVKAHIDKLKLIKLKDFEYNGNSYIELAYDTSKSLF